MQTAEVDVPHEAGPWQGATRKLWMYQGAYRLLLLLIFAMQFNALLFAAVWRLLPCGDLTQECALSRQTASVAAVLCQIIASALGFLVAICGMFVHRALIPTVPQLHDQLCLGERLLLGYVALLLASFSGVWWLWSAVIALQWVQLIDMAWYLCHARTLILGVPRVRYIEAWVAHMVE